MSKCPFCKNGVLIRKAKPKVHTYKNLTIKIQQPGNWCNKCEEGALSRLDIREAERQLRDVHSRRNGLLTSFEIKDIRVRLQLTQKEAAHIFGGGPNAFSRYERGEATPMRATSNLLRLLVKYPGELEALKEAK